MKYVCWMPPLNGLSYVSVSLPERWTSFSPEKCQVDSSLHLKGIRWITSSPEVLGRLLLPLKGIRWMPLL